MLLVVSCMKLDQLNEMLLCCLIDRSSNLNLLSTLTEYKLITIGRP